MSNQILVSDPDVLVYHGMVGIILNTKCEMGYPTTRDTQDKQDSHVYDYQDSHVYDYYVMMLDGACIYLNEEQVRHPETDLITPEQVQAIISLLHKN